MGGWITKKLQPPLLEWGTKLQPPSFDEQKNKLQPPRLNFPTPLPVINDHSLIEGGQYIKRKMEKALFSNWKMEKA